MMNVMMVVVMTMMMHGRGERGARGEQQ